MASEHADMTRKKLFGLSFISQRHLALGFASWREFVFSVCRQKEHDEITMARALRYMIQRQPVEDNDADGVPQIAD